MDLNEICPKSCTPKERARAIWKWIKSGKYYVSELSVFDRALLNRFYGNILNC